MSTWDVPVALVLIVGSIVALAICIVKELRA